MTGGQLSELFLQELQEKSRDPEGPLPFTVRRSADLFLSTGSWGGSGCHMRPAGAGRGGAGVELSPACVQGPMSTPSPGEEVMEENYTNMHTLHMCVPCVCVSLVSTCRVTEGEPENGKVS